MHLIYTYDRSSNIRYMETYARRCHFVMHPLWFNVLFVSVISALLFIQIRCKLPTFKPIAWWKNQFGSEKQSNPRGPPGCIYADVASGLEDLRNEWRDISKQDAYEITVVTAYFQLKPFKKAPLLIYTPDLYKQWMTIFSRIKNPMVIYVDTDQNFRILNQLRERFGANKTRLIKVHQFDLWSFQLKDRILQIYNQPDYPVFSPNTVLPEYSCAMHAKFEVMSDAVEKNDFNTKYFSWLDIGLFREIVFERDDFTLSLPPHFNDEMVAYSEVYPYDSLLTPWQIVSENAVWVGGASFVGRHDVILVYAEEYRRTVTALLARDIMSTDQQVIYSMFHPSLGIAPRTKFQLYTTGGGADWFLLGYLSRERSALKSRKQVSSMYFQANQM